MRTFAIWVFGMLASMIVGGMIGAQLDALNHDYVTSMRMVWGALAGALIFACLRLWLSAPTKPPKA